MNNNETNAPIKLPVRIDQSDGEPPILVDADGLYVNLDRTVAALNEASALRAEVEGYRVMLATLDAADFDGDFCIHKFNGRYSAKEYDEDGACLLVTPYFDTAFEAYASIKPNAADGEEGTE